MLFKWLKKDLDIPDEFLSLISGSFMPSSAKSAFSDLVLKQLQNLFTYPHKMTHLTLDGVCKSVTH